MLSVLVPPAQYEDSSVVYVGHDQQEWLDELAEHLKHMKHSEEAYRVIEDLIKQFETAGFDTTNLKETIYNHVDDGRYSLFSDVYEYDR